MQVMNEVFLMVMKVSLTARNSFRRSSMLPLWMVKRAAAIWLMALARQWMLLQWPVGGGRCTQLQRQQEDLSSHWKQLHSITQPAPFRLYKTEKSMFYKNKS